MPPDNFQFPVDAFQIQNWTSWKKNFYSFFDGVLQIYVISVTSGNYFLAKISEVT